MNMSVFSAVGEVCLVDTFAKMAAAYQAACDIVNDEATDEEVAETLFNKACEIESVMTKPDVPMTGADMVLLARVILAGPDLEDGLAYTGVKPFIMKLLDSIIADEAAPSIYETRGFFEL